MVKPCRNKVDVWFTDGWRTQKLDTRHDIECIFAAGFIGNSLTAHKDLLTQKDSCGMCFECARQLGLIW